MAPPDFADIEKETEAEIDILLVVDLVDFRSFPQHCDWSIFEKTNREFLSLFLRNLSNNMYSFLQKVIENVHKII